MLAMLFIAATGAWAQGNEEWLSGIINGDFSGDDVSSFFKKEYPSIDVVPVVIDANVGKDGTPGIVVKSGDDTANASAEVWDSQFWIMLPEEMEEGTIIRVQFDCKASKSAKASSQCHAAPGSYLHWAALGDVNFTTEWQTFNAEFTVAGEANGMKSIAFNLQEEKSATDYYFDNFSVSYKKPAVITDWTDIIINGNMEGDNFECFYVTEQNVGGPYVAMVTEGIGKDGSKAVKVQSADNPAEEWDTQFFIRLPYQLPAGTKYRVSFDYKADKSADYSTQVHTEPGSYIHWAGIGNGNFTTDWQTYEAQGTISADQSKEGQVMQTIAFNLAISMVATEYVFDHHW